MRVSLSLLPLFLLGTFAIPSSLLQRRNDTIPPFFLLAGDSTTATQSADGGGWGDGFINTTLFNGARGINYGHDGATTVSYRSGGYWATVLEKVQEYKSDYRTFVTIQFGDNDQKPAANITVPEYTGNLEQFVHDVRNAGGTPILVTPLSRRDYDNSTGTPTIILNLEDQRNATIVAAERTDAAWIDLNKASTDYLNAIGPADAYTYNLDADDYTHINVEGSQVFGGMVAALIDQIFPELKNDGYLEVYPNLLTALEEGEYYWP